LAFIQEVISNLHVKDLFDIFVVAFIIYELLIIIHGTRAVQILIGVGAICALQWVSVSYELNSLNWLLGHVFSSFFLVIVILFQDDIKTVLANVGGAKVFNRDLEKDSDLGIEEVVEACLAMSREKLGAIIVFEKRQGLGRFIDTGTSLRSQVHSDLLYSIFQTGSPLHDGAVIVGQGQIKAAGVFLPLSHNYDIDRHLGTRHRAALGITEHTDAVVVTVSEETGKMSLCYDGIFYAMKDTKSLRKQLRQLVLEEWKNKRKKGNSFLKRI
jgi:diadenylate cyclase